MTLLSVIDKADEDIREIDTDFSRWLAVGEELFDAVATIEDSTVDPSTLAVDAPALTIDRVKVRISGGVTGESAYLKIVATTTTGLTKEISYRVRVTER